MKKIKLLYLTNSLDAYSETFIHNTINQLLKIEYIDLDIKTLHKSNVYFFRFQFIFWFYNFSKKFNLRFIKYFILDFLFNKNANYIFIDYGNNAFEFYDYLEKRNRKIIVHLHGFDISKLLFASKYRNFLIKFSQKHRFIVPSQFSANRLVTLGCIKNNIKIIPYAFLGYSELNFLKISEYKYDLVFVGRFVSKKDPRILIYVLNEITKKMPNVKLLMIGNGYLFNDVIDLVSKFKLDGNVKLTGEQNHNQVLRYLKNSKIYVQHSVTSVDGDQEGFPNSIVEASALGLPVVSTVHAGIPEIILNGQSGFLVQEYDYMMMAEKIIQLLSNEKLRIQFGNFGRNFIKEKCDPDKRIAAIEQLLNV